MDQSSTLRRISRERLQSGGSASTTRVLSISSGKGGVGKSNFVLNVGICLAMQKKKVLVLDADMGLANIDILLGLNTRNNLSHVIANEKTLEDIIVEGPAGVHILPAASGVEWMTELSREQRMELLEKMDALNGVYDILLIDTGAGIASNVIYFNLAAQNRILLVTPEPTSLTDAYALIKVMYQSYQQRSFEIVVNQVRSEKEGLDVYRNLTRVADHYLEGVRLGFLGHVRHDDALGRAVLRQKPVVMAAPDSAVAVDYFKCSRKIPQLKGSMMDSELGLFWRKMLEPEN